MSVSQTSSPSCSCCASQCWETRVGQEMYKLTVFDLLIAIATLVLVEFPRRYTPPRQHVQGKMCSLVTVPCSPVCVRQDGGRQLVQCAGAEAGTTGVCHSLQRPGAGLRSDCGLDRGSLLPPASAHQHRQIYHCLLLQEGEYVTAATGSQTCFVSLTPFRVSMAVVSPQVTLFYNCRPALRTFRSTTSNFFFLVVLLFGWGLATSVMVYSVAA